jgi:hypothetical protein
MVYGTPQTGITSLVPGDSMTLFDGTEAAAVGLASIPFSRGYSPSGDDAGSSFFVRGGAVTTAVDVQGANENVDAQYLTLDTLVPDANGNAAYTDIGRAAFYRYKISARGGGDPMPVCTVQR